jgi:hypothetical protein
MFYDNMDYQLNKILEQIAAIFLVGEKHAEWCSMDVCARPVIGQCCMCRNIRACM